MAGLPPKMPARRSGINNRKLTKGKLGAPPQPRQPPICPKLGRYLGRFATDPSTLEVGEWWYNTAEQRFKWSDGTRVYLICCPECGSSRAWKGGWRKTKYGKVPRFRCRDCGLRFSESTAQPKVKIDITSKILKCPRSQTDHTNGLTSRRDPSFEIGADHLSLSSGEDVAPHDPSKSTIIGNVYESYRHIGRRRVRVSERETKNLVKVETREKRAAGPTKPDIKTTKGLIAKYAYWLEKEGYKSKAYLNLLRLLAKDGADLLDPEDVKAAIARQPWKDSVKLLSVQAYTAFTKMLDIQWRPPRYKREESLPFVPEESELDQLIAAAKSRRMSTFLQTLKETFADPGEALGLRWIDIDFKNGVVSINHPVKGHNPRQRKVSGKLLAMLNALPRKSDLVFAAKYGNIYRCFQNVRKRAAQTLQNPRLRKISFTTFRHWGGTMLAHYTHGNVLAVQKALGHKRIKNTMKYIHMIYFKDNEFDIATATTVEEVKELLAQGFEKADEIQEFHVYRRPKRFGC